MFNTRLKQELEATKQAFSSAQQIKDSLYQEMLVLELDLEARITCANENFLSAMGYSLEKLLGRSLNELIPLSYRQPDHYPKLLEALRQGKHQACTFHILRADGREAWLRAIWQPITNTQGKVQSITLCADDLTSTIETNKDTRA